MSGMCVALVSLHFPGVCALQSVNSSFDLIEIGASNPKRIGNGGVAQDLIC